MVKNYVSVLTSENKKLIYVKNPDRLNEIINKLINDGFEKLHIVSDFDKTITKIHHNGENHATSFGMFTFCPSVPSKYKEDEILLNEKYRPLETDPSIPLAEKVAHMEEWWKKSEEILMGLKVSPNEIKQVVKETGSSLRDGTHDMFHLLAKKNVPIIVFSAGLGESVEYVLDDHALCLPNVKVVSNFLNYDSNGTILGFKHAPIQVYNKNEKVLKEFGCDRYIQGRTNVILMGDSLGDSHMASEGPNTSTVLKIGFLDDKVDMNLPNYMEAFDIVLVNDDTMDIIRTILKLINFKNTE